MIAASLVMSPWSEPWTYVAIAAMTMVEVAADYALLRLLAVATRGLVGRLVVVQLSTWLAVIAFVDWLMWHDRNLSGWGVLVLQLIVVVAEFGAIRFACSVSLAGSPPVPLRVRTAVGLVLVGNGAAAAAVFGSVFVLDALRS